MNSSWTSRFLYDLAEWRNGLAFSDIHFSSLGKPVVKIAELKNGITFQTKYTQDVFDESVALKKGDMLFSWSGNPETSIDVFYYNLPDGWLNQHIFKVTPKVVERDFLFYLLRYLKPTFTAIASNKQTTGLGHVTVKDLKELVVAVPSPQEQRYIARILKSLDDKIDNNNRINHQLEQMAQAIFKSWFVDFEPFADGEFIESELGEVPAGWRVGKLAELVTVRYGKEHKKLADGTIPVFGSGGIMRYVDTPLYSDESVLIPRKGTLSNVIYVNQPFWSVDTMFFTEMNHPNLAKFVYFFVRSKDLASMNAGSAVPSMTTEILNALPVVIPSDSILARFENVVGVQFTQIQASQAESDNIASIRDLLLPRLMSGEISVANLDTAN